MSARKINKWLLPLTGALVAAALFRSSREKKDLTVKYYSLSDSRIKKPLRIAFLTDLHGNTFGKDNEKLLKRIIDAKPDVVLIGGDMMVVKPYQKMDFSALKSVLKGLSGRFPIYYAEGNHEQRMRIEAGCYPGWRQEFRKLLKKYKVEYLADKGVSLGEGVNLWGLCITKKYYKRFPIRKRMSASYLKRHLKTDISENKERLNIVMAHTPQYMESYWQGGADFVLSGHFHGGTVVLPIIGPLISPQPSLFPRYAKGWYEEKNGVGKCAVSAGLGTHSINFRLFNKPELVVIDLFPEEWNDDL